jgi:hypothetical protein
MPVLLKVFKSRGVCNLAHRNNLLSIKFLKYSIKSFSETYLVLQAESAIADQTGVKRPIVISLGLWMTSRYCGRRLFGYPISFGYMHEAKKMRLCKI